MTDATNDGNVPAGAASGGVAPAAPAGPALVEWLATDAGSRNNTLSDGCHTVSYADTPHLLAAIDRHLARSGVTAAHPIGLECSQSIAGALMLLHLLARQYDAVLLPDVRAGAKEAGLPRFIPSFCSHVITASAAPAGAEPWSPESGIACAANAAMAGDPPLGHLVEPRLCLRTSGSTGHPKLTVMSHRKWLNNALGCVARWNLSAGDRLSVPVPIFHSYGFGAAFLPGLLAGASMDILPDGSVVSYVAREAHFKPNVAFLTPAMCDVFLARRPSPRAYRLVVTAGDRIRRDTMARFEQRFGPLLNLYGSAEMGAVSSAAPDDPFERRLATAGYPLPGIEVSVKETASEEPYEAGPEVGVLHCRQRNGSDGYLIHDGEWRFEPREEEAWFDMRDLARLRVDGYVEILGRIGSSVKRDGLLVVIADVEAAAEQADGVLRSVVVAAGEGPRGCRLIAVCQADPARRAPRPDDVRRHCQERLPRYAVPDEVLIVDAFPQLPSGKIDRRALRHMVAPPASAADEPDTRPLAV